MTTHKEQYEEAVPFLAEDDRFPIGMVSIHFDDGHRTALEYGIPKLNEMGIRSNQFIVSGYFKDPDFIHPDEMLDIQADGHVIGGHTRTHSKHFKDMPPDKQCEEINGGRQDLLKAGATPVLTFAYPRNQGAGIPATVKLIKEAGFIAARTTNPGFNTKSTDRFELRRCPDDWQKTDLENAKNLIDRAAADRTWLILVFHRLVHDTDRTNTAPELFNGIIHYVAEQRDKQAIRVVTTEEGIEMMH